VEDRVQTNEFELHIVIVETVETVTVGTTSKGSYKTGYAAAVTVVVPVDSSLFDGMWKDVEGR
jgi:hypothetical protein